MVTRPLNSAPCIDQAPILGRITVALRARSQQLWKPTSWSRHQRHDSVPIHIQTI